MSAFKETMNEEFRKTGFPKPSLGDKAYYNAFCIGFTMGGKAVIDQVSQFISEESDLSNKVNQLQRLIEKLSTFVS